MLTARAVRQDTRGLPPLVDCAPAAPWALTAPDAAWLDATVLATDDPAHLAAWAKAAAAPAPWVTGRARADPLQDAFACDAEQAADGGPVARRDHRAGFHVSAFTGRHAATQVPCRESVRR